MDCLTWLTWYCNGCDAALKFPCHSSTRASWLNQMSIWISRKDVACQTMLLHSPAWLFNYSNPWTWLGKDNLWRSQGIATKWYTTTSWKGNYSNDLCWCKSLSWLYYRSIKPNSGRLLFKEATSCPDCNVWFWIYGSKNSDGINHQTSNHIVISWSPYQVHQLPIWW